MYSVFAVSLKGKGEKYTKNEKGCRPNQCVNGGEGFFGCWRVAAGRQAEPGWGKNVFY